MDKASPHYKSKKVQKYFEGDNDTLIRHIFQLMHHQRVHGDGKGGMEHSQTGFACSKVLCITYRFKKQGIWIFQKKRFNLDMRNYLLRDVYKLC
jgi:hypothetical protein